MSACAYERMSRRNPENDECHFFTESDIGIDQNQIKNGDRINCLILPPRPVETDKFELPPFLRGEEENTGSGYTRLTYAVPRVHLHLPVRQGELRWRVSRIHINGSYFGSDETAKLDAEARYLGRSIFLDLLASLEMVFRSPTPKVDDSKSEFFPTNG